MKYCISCGSPLEPTDVFCGNCGDRVEPDMMSGPLGDSAPVPSKGDASCSWQGAAVSPLPSALEERASDIAPTEVWGIGDPLGSEFDQVPSTPPVCAPKFEPPTESPAKPRCEFQPVPAWSVEPVAVPASDADLDADSPTVVASAGEDADDSPTIVVANERYLLTRQKNGERIELAVPCIVGRGSASDCKVKGNPAISRKHVKVFLENGLVMAQDLASTNKTHVDGVILPGGEAASLADGSVLRLGDEDFSFSIERV